MHEAAHHPPVPDQQPPACALRTHHRYTTGESNA